MLFHIIDKKNLSGLDGGPLDCFLIDLHGRFFETHLVGQNPLIKGPNDGKFRKDVVEVERIGVGKKPELPSPLLGENGPGNLLILRKDVIPDRDEVLEREGELKKFS
jgi:hypothetical protein